jgi:hypothetical protein
MPQGYDTEPAGYIDEWVTATRASIDAPITTAIGNLLGRGFSSE